MAEGHARERNKGQYDHQDIGIRLRRCKIFKKSALILCDAENMLRMFAHYIILYLIYLTDRNVKKIVRF